MYYELYVFPLRLPLILNTESIDWSQVAPERWRILASFPGYDDIRWQVGFSPFVAMYLVSLEFSEV